MAELIFVTQRPGLRSRTGEALPVGSKLTLEDVAGWPLLGVNVEHGVLRLEVDGVPLDRLVAAAALKVTTRVQPTGGYVNARKRDAAPAEKHVDVAELPRADAPPPAVEHVEKKPTSKQTRG